MHIIVLGGGVTGMFTSYYLTKAGHNVSLVDKRSQNSGTSIYNAGLITPSFTPAPHIGFLKIISALFGSRGAIYISPREVLKNPGWFLTALRRGITGYEKEIMELGMKSLKLYKDFFKEESVDVDLIQGVVGLYLKGEDARAAVEMFNGRFADEGECNAMGFRGFGGGVLFEKELSINPPKLFNELQRRLTEMGVRLIACDEVKLKTEDGSVSMAILDGRQLVGDAYVITAGANSKELLRPLRYDPHVLPARGLAMIFDTGGAQVADYPALLEDYGVGLVQHNNATVRTTSFFEFEGFKMEFAESRKMWLKEIVAKHLAQNERLRLVEIGVGYRPCTPDQLPVIGAVPGFRNAYVATGNCRLGVTLAPVSARIVCSLISGSPLNDIQPSHFDPSRFSKQKL